MKSPASFKVTTLGERTVPSPLNLSTCVGDDLANYVPDQARILLETEAMGDDPVDTSQRLEKAGPREKLFFDPARTTAAVVTCGGLCPGINNVVRSLAYELHYKYGVRRILGFRFGYQGMNPSVGQPPLELTPDFVRHIHKRGGTALGSSRGSQDPAVMVDYLERLGVDILYTIGGDGTLRGAHAIAEEIARRGRNISVIGIPKTIDNDVAFVDKTFGFETAVEMASEALESAHSEAISALNGVGLVKLMGRDSGFIAAQATLACMEVNFCLVPEVKLTMDGEHGLLAALEKRLAERQHALVAVAEGVTLGDGSEVERDASGNVRYASGAGSDVGPLLRDHIVRHMKGRGKPVTVKYIDPSYMIRSIPANADDSVFCDRLARHAAHAGMAGKTDMLVGRLNQGFIHVPIPVAAGHRKKIDPEGGLWLSVLEATGQPNFS